MEIVEHITAPIWFRRNGRQKRARGSVLALDTGTGLYKVKPARKAWKTVWISTQELQGGGTTTPKAEPPHIPVVRKMVAGLLELEARKESHV